jgi:hypothetical protein
MFVFMTNAVHHVYGFLQLPKTALTKKLFLKSDDQD